jgi:hypothetical protein
MSLRHCSRCCYCTEQRGQYSRIQTLLACVVGVGTCTEHHTEQRTMICRISKTANLYGLDQWSSIWNTRTPGGMRKHLTEYVKSEKLCYLMHYFGIYNLFNLI